MGTIDDLNDLVRRANEGATSDGVAPSDPLDQAFPDAALQPEPEAEGDIARLLAARAAEVPQIPEFRYADNQELQRRANAFRATVPDYDQMLVAYTWPVPPHIEACYRSLENGPRLGYYLARHGFLFATILVATPADAFARLIALDRQLEHRSRTLEPDVLYAYEWNTTPTAHDVQAAANLLRLLCLEHTKRSN